MPEATPTEVIAAARPTLRSAIEYALPYMGDDNIGLKSHDPALGSQLLVAWGRLHLSWKMVEQSGDIPTLDIYRDPGRYRGTRVCVRGAATTPGQPTWPTEVMIRRDQMPDALLLLVNYEGSIKSEIQVRACGVFVGTFLHGIAIVGMLDTPQSRKYLPSVPLPADMDGPRPSASRPQQGAVPL